MSLENGALKGHILYMFFLMQLVCKTPVPVSCLLMSDDLFHSFSSILKMGAAGFSEILVFQTT
jgi:hypothetical protein